MENARFSPRIGHTGAWSADLKMQMGRLGAARHCLIKVSPTSCMILRSETIQQWWPTTQALDIVKGPGWRWSPPPCKRKSDALLQAEPLPPPHGKPFLTWMRHFAAPQSSPTCRPFILVLPTHSKWSVLWNNSFLCDGYDSLCHCLTKNHGLTTVHWSAHDQWTSFQSGAGFTHRRQVGAKVVEPSCLTAAQDNNRWLFFSRTANLWLRRI